MERSIQRVDLPVGVAPEDIEVLLCVDQGLDGQYGQTCLVRQGDILAALHRSSSFGSYGLAPLLEGSAPRLSAGRWGSHELVFVTAEGEHSLGLSHGEREQAIPILEALYRGGDHHRELAELLTGRLEIERVSEVRRELLAELARLLAEQLADPEAACARWQEMLELNGEDAEASQRLEGLIDGGVVGEQAAGFLDRLYREQRRFQPLVTVLAKRARQREPVDAEMLLEAVEICRRELGEPGRALALAGEVLALEPSRPERLQLVDDLAAVSADWRQAARWYRTAEQATDDLELDVVFLGRIGDAMRRAGDLQEATAAYLEITWLDPTRVAAHLRVDELYAERGLAAERVEVLERLVELSPGDSERVVHTRSLGQVLVALGEIEAALAAERRILGWVPGDAAALETVSALLRSLERFDELLAVLLQRATAALNAELKTELLAEAAELAELALGDSAQAVDLWQKIVSLRPRHRRALEELARLLQQLERWEPLVTTIERLIELEEVPAIVAERARGAAGIAIERLGDFERAAALFEKVVAIDPTDRGALEATCVLYQKLGRADAEVASVERLLASGALSAADERSWALARARLLSGPIADAKRALPAWLDLLDTTGPQDLEALDAAIEACSALGEPRALLSRMDPWLGQLGDGPEGLALLARKAELEVAAGLRQEALSSYSDILAIDPSSASAFPRAVELARGLGHWEVLLRLLRERGAALPADAAACALEAAQIAHRHLGQSELGLVMLAGALGLEPERDGDILDEIGAVATESGRWREALEPLDARLAVLDRGRRRALRKALNRLIARLDAVRRDRDERAALWARIAEHHELARHAPRTALRWYRRAFELRPRSSELELSVRRLLERLEHHEELAAHLRCELDRDRFQGSARRRRQRQLADLYDTQLNAPEEAEKIRRELSRWPLLLLLAAVAATVLAYLILR